MTRKKSRFLTFCCSLIPGAGEMYLGFLKQGVSIMTLFLGLFAVCGVVFPPAVTFCSVVWFYSFFHTHNLNNLPDDEFYAIQDEYIIHFSQLVHGKDVLLNQYRKLFAIVLIFLGASIIWNKVNECLMYIAYDVLALPEDFMSAFQWFSRSLPQMIIALAIIAAGLYLIRNKKNELLGLEDSHFGGTP